MNKRKWEKHTYYELDRTKTIKELLLDVSFQSLKKELTVSKLKNDLTFQPVLNCLWFGDYTLKFQQKQGNSLQRVIGNPEDIDSLEICYWNDILFFTHGKTRVAKTVPIKNNKISLTQIKREFDYIEKLHREAEDFIENT